MPARFGDDLVSTIRSFLPDGPEQRFAKSAWEVLAMDPSNWTRAGKPCHFTASALPVTRDGRSVCLVLHGRLGLWVQPGGHFEPGDAGVVPAARREMLEETGLEGDVDPEPLRLSRHPAPCGVGDWHLDLQLLAVTAPMRPTLSEESHDVAWFEVDRLPDGLAPGVPALVESARTRVSRTFPGESPTPGG